jgi:hypothetical protein
MFKGCKKYNCYVKENNPPLSFDKEGLFLFSPGL